MFGFSILKQGLVCLVVGFKPPYLADHGFEFLIFPSSPQESVASMNTSSLQLFTQTLEDF